MAPNTNSVAIHAETNTNYAFGPAIEGLALGPGGMGGYFYTASGGRGLVARSDGSGPAIEVAAGSDVAIRAIAASYSTAGIYAITHGPGSAIDANVDIWNQQGRAGRFSTNSASNPNPTLEVVTSSPNAALLINQVHNASPGNIAVLQNKGVNVARIDRTGRGFFNGGAATSGADLAEIVPTTGPMPEPGDVVEIDPAQPERFRLSSEANTTRVAGVITTDPGVTLNVRDGAEKPASGPGLALAGRVPVKVTAEGGPIRIGDLLVAAKTPGRAMRAPANPAPGTIVGKALRSSDKSGVIEMLVMLR